MLKDRTERVNLTVFLIFIGVLLFLMFFSCQVAYTSILDDVVEGVQKVVVSELDKVEQNINAFVSAEIRKVERQALLSYLVVIFINIVYSTALILVCRRVFGRGV